MWHSGLLQPSQCSTRYPTRYTPGYDALYWFPRVSRVPPGPGPQAQLHARLDQHGNLVRQPRRVRQVRGAVVGVPPAVPLARLPFTSASCFPLVPRFGRLYPSPALPYSLSALPLAMHNCSWSSARS